MQPPVETEATIESAFEAFLQGYSRTDNDGQITTLQALDGAPEAKVVALRFGNFRDDPGNWPKVIHHGAPTHRAIVLTHGFKDSPAYLHDIAGRFAAQGLNVVLPLLPAHGRKDPVAAMRHVDYQDWRATVDDAVAIATMLGREVSIGGLSTGGLLALDKILRQPTGTHPSSITGKAFLFSAALGLTRIQRWILSTDVLAHWRDAWMSRHPNNGLGGNPHKYSRTFLTGARQVHRIIENLGQLGIPAPRLLAEIAASDRYRDRIFVAHSEADTTIRFDAVKSLVRPDDPGQHHIMAKVIGVRHADLVLAHDQSYKPRWPDEPPPPRANPEFDLMMDKALAFLER